MTNVIYQPIIFTVGKVLDYKFLFFYYIFFDNFM